MLRRAFELVLGLVFLVVAVVACLAFAACMPPDPHVRPFLSNE
jgi:hypothetical protein